MSPPKFTPTQVRRTNIPIHQDKSNPKLCETCPHIVQYTESKLHQKVVVRHVWADCIDITEDIRLTPKGKHLYAKRKETIEQIFRTAKEHHAMRYTQQVGKEKMA